MKRLRFQYKMELDFSLAAYNHRFSVKCLPAVNEMQNLLECHLEIRPKVPLSYSSDSFGNRFIYGIIEEPHLSFSAEQCGVALCGMRKGHDVVARTLSLYRYQSALTRPGEALFAMEKKACGQAGITSSQLLIGERPEIYPQDAHLQEDLYEKPLTGEQILQISAFYTQYLYEAMRYVPGATGTQTTAEEAAAQGCGVCQDYSHIMLSLLRIHHIPCRYVVGLMCGEGASHAWVEVAADGTWYGFDPTNGRMTDDTYLYISFGRDAKDCLVNRGVFIGGGLQTQTVYASLAVQEE